jgi:hypothetical protein
VSHGRRKDDLSACRGQQQKRGAALSRSIIGSPKTSEHLTEVVRATPAAARGGCAGGIEWMRDTAPEARRF